jgi:hypothetical protein
MKKSHFGLKAKGILIADARVKKSPPLETSGLAAVTKKVRLDELSEIS